MTRQDLVDRLVAERFAPPIRQAPTTTLGTARLLTASAEAARVSCEACGDLDFPDSPCPTCRKERP